ncbi:hypothetical protein [Microcystis sp.]|uniref:hypothetical protein n=1 Tax=Microcystis sp. TaxID=1127 RepID=UPI00391CFEB3
MKLYGNRITGKFNDQAVPQRTRDLSRPVFRGSDRFSHAESVGDGLTRFFTGTEEGGGIEGLVHGRSGRFFHYRLSETSNSHFENKRR